MTNKKTIVILGGGIGGQAAANALAVRVGRRHRIVLVEREEDFVFSPSFLWLVTGERTPERIRKPTARMLRPEVELVRADVAAIRPAEKFVDTSAGRLEFDFLVISLGAELAPEKVPGFADAALNLYTLEGALAIGEKLRTFGAGRIAVVISSSPFKCPAAPYEAAFLVRDHLSRRGGRGRRLHAGAVSHADGRAASRRGAARHATGQGHRLSSRPEGRSNRREGEDGRVRGRDPRRLRQRQLLRRYSADEALRAVAGLALGKGALRKVVAGPVRRAPGGARAHDAPRRQDEGPPGPTLNAALRSSGTNLLHVHGVWDTSGDRFISR